MKPQLSIAAAITAFLLVGCQSAERLNGPGVAPENRLSDLGILPICPTVTLFVQSGADPGSTGTAVAPFADIRSALAVAEKIKCGVRIDVADGVYDESGPQVPGPLTISRSLSVIGHGNATIDGSMLVTASGPVLLQGLEIADAVDAGIRVTNPQAALRLNAVRVTHPAGYGVVQYGGALTLFGVEIANTTTTDKDPATGAALSISGGAHADLLFVFLHDNVHGLYATGAGTTVNASGLVVQNTRVHYGLPALIGAGSCRGFGNNHFGGVEFSYGAVGTGFGWSIDQSALVGLYVHDGASVRVNGVEVSFATSVAGTGPHTDVCGGFDVAAMRGGQIELSRLAITDADVCGVVVGPETGTGMDLHVGFITRVPIGACVQQDGYVVSRLADRVEYRDVGVPLQATSYTLPEPPE
jgi:hypothetical protein